MVCSLQKAKERLGDDELAKFLSTFSCTRDTDLEKFLHHRATEFEKLSKARTYLILDSMEFENGKKYPVIYGYLSLALKTLSVSDTTSNRTRKELDGFHSKIHGRRIKDFPCYLIGQLSKNSNVKENSN